MSGATITKNIVSGVYDSTTSGFGSYGINLAAGNNHIVTNNFVTDINAFWTLVSGSITQYVTLREARFYEVPEGGPFPIRDPRGHMGDPVKIAAINRPGTNTSGAMPPQVACSVTFKTAHRLRWGRFYLPHPARNTVGDKGALNADVADAFLQGAHALTGRGGSGCCLTVFSHKYWNHEDPETIQIDDVLDVVRRRRYSRPTARWTLPAG